tara:strand:+ start:3474 stop:4187 length:714 start_codon:yes stop_codon:yes gene_type:complete
MNNNTLIFVLLIFAAVVIFWYFKIYKSPVIKDTSIKKLESTKNFLPTPTIKKTEQIRNPQNPLNEIHEESLCETTFDEDLKAVFDIDINGDYVGSIEFLLYDKITPRTVENFSKLILNNNYKQTLFHRIIPGFMAQGGDFERGDGTGGTSIYGSTFDDENFIKKHSKRGILSMANSGPHTNGSQFFILFNETPHLDNKHVVFGEMIEGDEILSLIESYGTEDGTPRAQIIISDCKLL